MTRGARRGLHFAGLALTMQSALRTTKATLDSCVALLYFDLKLCDAEFERETFPDYTRHRSVEDVAAMLSAKISAGAFASLSSSTSAGSCSTAEQDLVYDVLGDREAFAFANGDGDGDGDDASIAEEAEEDLYLACLERAQDLFDECLA